MTMKELLEKERWATEQVVLEGKFDAFREAQIFHPDVTFHIPPFPDFQGLDVFEQSMTGFAQAIAVSEWNWHEVVIEGNTAVQRHSAKGKHIGTSATIQVPPTGKQVSLEGCAIYHVEGGKIIEFIEYSNFLGLFQQLGMIPGPE